MPLNPVWPPPPSRASRLPTRTVSKQPAGGWRPITGGFGGWPDIEIGGPGFCFPVHRWNGKGYALHRFQYEGKACRPNR